MGPVQLYRSPILLLLVWPAGTPPITLQPSRPFVLLTPFNSPSSPEELHARRRERRLLAKAAIMGEKWPVKFSQAIRLPRNHWVI
jgi:hypothetical protein